MAFAHSPQIVTSGLVLSLDAGNIKSYASGSTTWFDKSGFSNNGTLVNGPTFNTGSLGSIVFDGVDDYVSIPNASTLNMGGKSFTGDVWIKIPNSSGGERIIFEYNIWGATGTYQLTTLPGPTIRINWPETYALGTFLDYTYPPLTQNIWTQIVAKFDTSANIISLYINGSLVSQVTNATAEIGNVTSTMYIMSRGGSALFLPGNLASFKMYNRALSDQEVSQNFNALRGRFGI
jgi:hypothetical protein